MPMKTAGKKLLPAVLCLLAALALLACLPLLRAEKEIFVPIAHGGGVTLPLDGGFAALDSGGLAIYSGRGELLYEEKRPLDPAMSAAEGGLLAVCHGEQVLLYTAAGPAGTIEDRGQILALAVRRGSVAVSRAGSWYPCTVTFYARTEPLFMRCLAAGRCTAILLGEESACLMLEEELVVLSGPEETARVPLPGVLALYPAGEGLCAETAQTLRFFTWTGKDAGSYSEPFGAVQSFGGTVCVRTAHGADALNGDGSVRGSWTGSGFLAFGSGARPVLITGEKTSVLNHKMEILYTIENKYIPTDVITEKNAAAVLWPLAAEIYRK